MAHKSNLQWYADRLRLAYIMRKNRKTRDPKFYMFLDFDGVINVFFREGTPEYEEAISKENFEFVSRQAVDRLNLLCEEFPLTIIISSSWRFAGLPYCQEYLHNAGLDDRFTPVDLTNTEVWKLREEEITDYLFAHPDFTGFIIYDDGNMPHLLEYLVHTDPCKGLDEKKYSASRKILSGFLK